MGVVRVVGPLSWFSAALIKFPLRQSVGSRKPITLMSVCIGLHVLDITINYLALLLAM